MKIKKRKKLALLLLGAVMACSAGGITAKKAGKGGPPEGGFGSPQFIKEIFFRALGGF